MKTGKGREPLEVEYASPQYGLTREQVQRRQRLGYRNDPIKSRSKSLPQIILSNLFTYFNLLFFLLAAAVIAVGAYKNLTFMVVVLANLIIGIVQEWRSKRQLDRLELLSAPKATLIREGRGEECSVHEAVRDDIALFSAGDQIYADGEIVEGECLVNESLLTGEADELRRGPGDRLLSGSFLVAGSCRVRLTAVGEDSYMSRLTLQAKRRRGRHRSEILRSLGRLVAVIGVVILPLGALMAYKEILLLGAPLAEGVVSTVASLVGMIPEGLYLLTSLALLAGVVRLGQKRTLVHEMGCIETLARVDTLCVDKTGTITEPGMELVDIIPDDGVELAQISALLGDYVATQSDDNETMSALKRHFPEPGSRAAQEVLPFTSRRKYGAVTFTDGTTCLLGAPEILLAEDYPQYRQNLERHAAEGCRVLLFAQCEGLEGELPRGKVIPLGLVCLSNRIRPQAKETFRYFREQGVAIKVISGDNPLTASQVACRAGIDGAERWVDARTLTDDEALARAAEEYTVFGRVTPEQKRLLVCALHNAGHTVAMTGDGVNDVLALKEADCSVAMASGSQAACQVSHIVLLDSDFSAMPSVVAEGRRVINNIERSSTLYLVKNVFSFTLAVLSLLFTFGYPFTANQMALISGLTIGFPSFILAMEPNEGIIRGRFLTNAIYRALPSALSDVVLCVGAVVMSGVLGLTDAEVGTICTLVVGAVGLLLVHRVCRPYNLLRRLLMGACLIAFLFSTVVLRELFSLTIHMSLQGWLLLAVLLALAVIISAGAHTIVDLVRRLSWRIRWKIAGKS